MCPKEVLAVAAEEVDKEERKGLKYLFFLLLREKERDKKMGSCLDWLYQSSVVDKPLIGEGVGQ